MESDSHKPMQSLHCLQTCWSESQTSPWNIPRGRSSHTTIPEDPLLSFLICHQTSIFSQLPNSLRNRMEALKINSTGFLSLEEEKVNPTCHDIEWRSTLFWRSRAWNIQRVHISPHISSQPSHTSLGKYRNIPIPPGIRDQSQLKCLKTKSVLESMKAVNPHTDLDGSVFWRNLENYE